ncbi:MAG: response regulator transcription factor [Clostridia bacterium]|nr:response regulator transcription factor [Clostridia bacterium]
MAYNVLVVDDQNIPRRLFEMIVRESDRYNLLFALESAAVAPIYCARYRVDLVIMDIVMNDGSNGLDAAERIKKDYPSTKVLIVTSMIESAYLARAKSIGADGFWYKEAGDRELIEVMDRIMSGESVFPDNAPTLNIGMARSAEFTPAEIAVLREMTTGASNKEIAERLFIEVGTVKVHISHMLQKTGYKNRTELAIEARIRGLVVGEKT